MPGALEYLDSVNRMLSGSTAELEQLQGKLAETEKLFGAVNRARTIFVESGGMAKSTADIDQMKTKLISTKELFEKIGKAHLIEPGSLAKGTSGVEKLKDKLAEAADPKAKDGLTEFFGMLKKAGGPLGEVGGKLEGLAEKFNMAKASTAGALVVIAAAVVALGVAIGNAFIKLTEFALSAANAHRSFLLLLEGATGSAASAADASAAVDRVASRSALARDKVGELAKTLAEAGLSGALFEQTLWQMANASSVAGAQTATKFGEIIKKSQELKHFEVDKKSLDEAGLSMKDLADALGMSVDTMKAKMTAGAISVETGIDAMNKAMLDKFGGPAQKQLLGFDVQMMKLKENIAKLFEGIDLEPFLAALRNVLSVFDQSSASGKALKFIMTDFFNMIGGLAASVGPVIKQIFQGAVIAVLILYVEAKKVGKAISEYFGIAGGSIDWVEVGMYTVAGAIGAVVGLFTAVAVAIALVGAYLYGMFIAPFVALYELGELMVMGFKAQILGLVQLWELIKSGALWAWQAISDAASVAWGVIAEKFALAIAAIQAGWARISAAGTVVEKIKVAWTLVFALLENVISGAIENIKTKLSAAWDSVVSTATKLVATLSGVWSSIVTTVTSVVEPVITFFGGVWNTIAGGASSAFAGVVAFIAPLIAWIMGAFEPLQSFSIMEYGAQLINGFVEGALGMIGAVADMIANLAGTAMSVITSILGIQSPSKVFAEYGGHTAAGFAEGVDEGSTEVSAAVGKMVDVPDVGGKGGKGGKGGGAIRIDQINIYGRDAEDIWQQLEEKLTSLLERVDLSGPEPTGAS